MLRIATIPPSEPNAHQRRHKPEDSGQEGKRLRSSPAVAGTAAGNPTPVECARIAGVAGEVDEQTEGGEPAERHKDVDGPGHEAAGEGDQPYQSQQKGQAGDDEGVDEAGMWPGGVVC